MNIPGTNQQINIDIASCRDFKCVECGGIYFSELKFFKIVSKLMSPSGEAFPVPIPVLKCDMCGKIHDVDTIKSIIETPDISNI